VKYARGIWRAFLHDRSRAGFVRLIELDNAQGHVAESCRALGQDPKTEMVSKGSCSNKNVQQQSGSLGKTGKVPVTYAKGWTPS
jgi:hypothetical protein